MAKLAAFTGETGQPLRFTQSGALKIARTERDAEQLAREVKTGGAAGVPIDFVSVAEARKRLPILGEHGIVALTWSPTDCNVEPSELPIGYCRAAEKLGAVLLPHTPATGFEIGARGIEGVRTPGGTIATRAVVDATGAWARVVAAELGASLPVVPTRHQLLITEPIAGVGPEFPIARVIDANVYVRHERGGLMLGGYEADPLQPDALPDDVAELPLDIEGRWGTIRVAEHRGGLPTLTMDDRYLVGPLPGVAGARSWAPAGDKPPPYEAKRGDRRVDRRRGAGARPRRDLPRALRRPRPRRDRAARALPAPLRDQLPRGRRDVDRLVNHLSTVYRFGRIS